MPKILAIDDKKDNLITLSALLKNLMPGCTMITAQSGIEGIDKAKSEFPDVILLDVKMPEIDGFETCRRLKADESTKIIPVIMLTAIKTDPQSRIKGLEIGADAFLAKPIDECELVSQVKVALRIKKAEDALREERNSLEKKVQERTEALQESEGRFRYVLENVREAFWSADLSGQYDFLSPMMENIYGRSLLEMIENKAFWLEAVHPEDKATAQASGDTLVRDGQAELEYRIVLPDGTKRWISDRKTVLRDAYGEPYRIAGILYDITERRRTEELLRSSEARLREAQQISHIGNWVLDIQMNKPIWSEEIYRIFEIDWEGVVATYDTFLAAIHPDDRQLTIDAYSRSLKTHEPYEITYRLLMPDGRIKVVMENCENTYDSDGKPLRSVGIVQDITARRHTEEEKRDLQERLSRAEKMESLGLLAGGVAHDLNNVLGIVVGYAEMVLDAVDEKSPMRKDLKTIFEGGQRAAAIVDDLLTLARRGVVGKKVLNLNKLIGDFKKSPQWEKLLTYHPLVQIKTELDPDLLNISASSVHLEKTLYNLVSNAGEAMTSGGNITIKTNNRYIDKPISGYDTIQEGDYVVLSVSDEGGGISETDLRRVFEPFYTKKIMGRSGTGLGLSVVWGTVKDHQGYIDVQSEEGKGTTFTLYFLITREDVAEEGLTVSMSEYLGNGESILIVDDVTDQRDLAARLLTSLNYKVSSVPSGEEAIKYLKDHQPDLIVLDMIMDPGMDGLDTYKSILEINPKQKAIIVSGFSESDRVKEAKTIGAGAYVKKPYIKEKLGLAVKKELDKKR